MRQEKIVEFNIIGLTEHEMSAIQAGLTLLANSGRAGTLSYPEYKETAPGMLAKLGVTGYDYSKKSAPSDSLGEAAPSGF